MSRLPTRETARPSIRIPAEHRAPACGAVLFTIQCQPAELRRLRRNEGKAQPVAPICPHCGAAIGAADWRFGTPEEVR